MSRTIKVIFGKEQKDKWLNNIPFSYEEEKNNIKNYHFQTESEEIAFCLGLEEAVGWLELVILKT